MRGFRLIQHIKELLNMHTHNHTKADILAIFKFVNAAVGLDYFQYHSPLNQVQLMAIIEELIQDGDLVIVDKYHWKAK